MCHSSWVVGKVFAGEHLAFGLVGETLVCVSQRLSRFLSGVVMESDGVIPVLHVSGKTRLAALSIDSPEMGGFRIQAVSSVESAFQSLRELEFAAVLLDLTLNHGCGFEALLQLRRYFSVPILVLSCANEERNRVLAYEMGADDFLAEGISSRELAARLRVGIGRAMFPCENSGTMKPLLVAQNLQVDVEARKVRQSGELIELTTWEFDLLVDLVRRSGRTCTRDSLLSAVAGECFTVLDRTVDVHIASLRRKLGDNPKHPRYIRTIRGVGYCFCEENREHSSG